MGTWRVKSKKPTIVKIITDHAIKPSGVVLTMTTDSVYSSIKHLINTLTLFEYVVAQKRPRLIQLWSISDFLAPVFTAQ